VRRKEWNVRREERAEEEEEWVREVG